MLFRSEENKPKLKLSVDYILEVFTDDRYKNKPVHIKDYSLKTIRNNIVYVSQNERLFTDTIRNNILLDKNHQYLHQHI